MHGVCRIAEAEADAPGGGEEEGGRQQADGRGLLLSFATVSLSLYRQLYPQTRSVRAGKDGRRKVVELVCPGCRMH